ncbi:MAG: succinylglutamate desuccinylase/aspartoacylase family protein [Solirubrobacteraceae bacterium]
MLNNKIKSIIINKTEILPNTSSVLNLVKTKLFTNSTIKLPILIERAALEGPVVLITAGIHGDEVNGIEIVRQIIDKKINIPKKGTIICIPVLNVIGFTTRERYFPDKKDMNRVFPGSKIGSMASRIAYSLTSEVLPFVDLVIDFHTGGESRYNLPQIRIDSNNEKLLELSKIFKSPFIIESKTIKGSFRNQCKKNNILNLLYEGGKSNSISEKISFYGVEGIKRILSSYGMLKDEFKLEPINQEPIFIKKTRWIRTKYSGLLQIIKNHGSFVEKNDILARVTDPYGMYNYEIKSLYSGFIINVNEQALVIEGDAIFNLSVEG